MLAAPPLDDGATMMGTPSTRRRTRRRSRRLKEEMAKAVAKGFTADELKLARSGLLKERKQERANDQKLAQEMLKQLYVGRTMAFEQAIDDKLSTIDIAGVGSALKKHIDPSKWVTVKAGDFKKVAPPK